MLRATGLSKSFGHKPVLAGVDIHVPPRTTLGIIGPGGCGKTVLLKLFAGLERADAGTLAVGGREVQHLSEGAWSAVRMQMGMLFQNYALFDSMTVESNVAFPLYHGGPLDAAARELVREKLAQVGLYKAEHLYPKELSGGMKKRVGLARALIAKPAVLLLDEPSAGLDPVSTRTVNELILRLRAEEGFTAAIATFDFETIHEVVDRVVVLNDARILFSGTAAELKATREPLVRLLVDGEEVRV